MNLPVKCWFHLQGLIIQQTLLSFHLIRKTTEDEPHDKRRKVRVETINVHDEEDAAQHDLSEARYADGRKMEIEPDDPERWRPDDEVDTEPLDKMLIAKGIAGENELRRKREKQGVKFTVNDWFAMNVKNWDEEGILYAKVRGAEQKLIAELRELSESTISRMVADIEQHSRDWLAKGDVDD